MTSEIVIPRTQTLPVWASSRLNALLKSKTADRFDRIFEATFAKNVDVVFNGKSLTRDEYKKLLLARSEGGPLGTVDLQIEGETVFTPSPDRSGGFVGMFYTTVGVNKRILVFGAPATYKEVSSINLTVESTVPCPPVRLRYFDARRITAVNQVLSPGSYIVSYPESVISANEASVSGKVELSQAPLNIVEGEEGLSVLGNKFSTASVPEAQIDEE